MAYVPPSVLLPIDVAFDTVGGTPHSESDADRDGFAKLFVQMQQRLDQKTGKNVSPHVVYTRLPVLRLTILQNAMGALTRSERDQLRTDDALWQKVMMHYAQMLYDRSVSKRFDARQLAGILVQHMHRLEQGEHLSVRGKLVLQLDTSSDSSKYKRTLEQLRRAEMKLDRLAHGEPGSESDEEGGAMSESDNESHDTSLFTSSDDGSDVDALMDDVPNDLQLDMSQLSDSDNESRVVVVPPKSANITVVVTAPPEDEPLDDAEMFKQWRAHELQCAQEHYTDLRVPHVFAGVLHAETLLVDRDGVAVLHSHVTQQELLRILYLITEPQLMDYNNLRRAVKFLRSSSASPVPLVVCTGSTNAQRYLEQTVLPKEDARVRSLVLGPRSAAMREVAPWMHLCHLGEALYLRWLLDGVLPESPWHATLLMYTAQRMAVVAMLYGDTSQGGRAAQWMTAHVVAAGMWDDLKAKYNEVSQSLQQKFPAWRQTISDQLQKYAQQATVAMQNAYGTAKEWSAELAQKYEQQFKPWLIQQYGATKQWSAEMAQKYEQQFKPWLKQQYEEKLKPGAISAWNSTREASRKLVEYASQARQYVMQHMQDLVKRIKTDPRYAQLKEKLRALSQEAKQSGMQFWEYIKRQLDEGKLQGNELLEKVRLKIQELKVRLAQGTPPELSKALVATTPTTLSISATPLTPEGDLDLDFIQDYRSYTQNIQQRPRAPPPPAPIQVAVETPPVVPPRSFFEPIPESMQRDMFDRLSDQSLNVEPLPVPPPLPPRDFDESEDVDDMSKHMPTTWQSTPEAAALDAERLSRDLSEAMNQVQWWLSGNDSSYYNPVVVSSTLSLIEQVRDGVPPEMGGGKQHSAANHRNPIYQLMMRGSVQQDDNAHQLRRNQEIQRLVGIANLIMVETSYGVDSSSAGVAGDLGAYARTVERLVQQNVVSENDLEDLMAFIEAIEDQQLQLDALRGPFDKSIAAAAEMRVSGRAYAHELYHDQLVNRTRGALFSLADRTEQEVRATKTIHSDSVACDVHLQQALYNCESGIARSAIFHARNMVHWNWCDDKLARDIERVLQSIDENKSANVHAALLRWHQQLVERNSAKYDHSWLSDEQHERLLNVAYAFNWLYAAGSMLQLTHEWDPSMDQDASNDHLSLTSTWNLFVQPTLRNVCKKHQEFGLYKHDPLQLHTLDEEFYASLRHLTRPHTAADDNDAATHSYHRNAAQARQELAYFLHRCQPLDASQLPNTNQWHLLWEAITSTQVHAMHSPKQWETPHTPDHYRADPIAYWKEHDSLEYDEPLSDIVRRLQRATELERRCMRAHEFRMRESTFNVATNIEPHLTHMQHWMRAQRCWAVRTLRTYPEHFRQYALLEIECALGPLCQECLIPLPETKSSAQVDELRQDDVAASTSWTNAPIGGNGETWDRSQKISAQSVGDMESEASGDVVPHNTHAPQRTSDYAKPVAFRAIHIDAEYPAPVSVGAVMLEVHAARSWQEVAHIFASYGLLKHI